MVPLSHYLILGALLFAAGLVGMSVRRNIAAVVMALGLMGNAVVLNFAAFARYHGETDGQVMAFLVIGAGAAEIAVGICFFVAHFRSRRKADLDEMDRLKW